LRDVLPSTRSYFIGVGPEGGFTDTEIDAALGHGWQTIDLGSRILRVETAALFAASVVSLTSNDDSREK
ncbi:MAG TPA: RsmE family RNA methyltransferase, partial [Pirellulales bacterium]|nr:RsmE family RNA methyltransferase [Pirellulales bacterium]